MIVINDDCIFTFSFVFLTSSDFNQKVNSTGTICFFLLKTSCGLAWVPEITTPVGVTAPVSFSKSCEVPSLSSMFEEPSFKRK